MAKASPIFSAFNGGEYSPFMDGRCDQEKYFTGCKTLENFIPTVPGPAVKRGGLRFVAEVKDSDDPVWLVRWEFSQDQAYVLEFGNLYIRFFTNRGQLLDTGTPYEVVTPYTLADLTTADGTFALSAVQSADVLYIAHASYQPYVLRRLGATNWTLTAFEPEGGPFIELPKPTATITVYASAVTGTGITLTASSSIFQAGHIGRLFYIEPENPTTIKPWKPGGRVVTGDFRRNAGNYYEALNNSSNPPATAAADDNRGISPPLHERGTGSDGDVVWQFLHSGYGIVRITAQAGTTATADVISQLPAEVVGSGNTTKYWAHQAWSSVEGWPSAVTFFRERLTFGKGRTVYTSQAGNFDNFNRKVGPDVTPDAALVLPISSDRVDSIRWLAPLKRALGIGTSGGEVALAEAVETQPFGAENATAVPQTDFGSRRLPALRVGNVALFLQRAGRKLREYRYAYEVDQFVAPDLTILAEHVSEAGIVDYCYQQEPDNLVWCARADGALIGLTYNRDRGVTGWHRHPLATGILVETVEAIPSPDGTRDDLWLVVRLTVSGSTKRYVCFMESALRDEQDKEDAFYVDLGLTYSGAPATTLSGLDHIEGWSVQTLGDGAVLPPKTVVGGSITHDTAVSKAHVGIGFTAKLQTMRVESGASDGTAQAKLKRIHKVAFRLLRTLGGKYGPSFSALTEILFRSSANPMDASPPLFTGDKTNLPFEGDWATDGYVCFQHDQPLPATVVAIMPQLQTNDS